MNDDDADDYDVLSTNTVEKINHIKIASFFVLSIFCLLYNYLEISTPVLPTMILNEFFFYICRPNIT